MFAYLVAGLIVGGLIWFLRHEPGDPPIFIQLVVGAIAGGVGGLVLNVLLGEDFMAVDPWGFAGSGDRGRGRAGVRAVARPPRTAADTAEARGPADA